MPRRTFYVYILASAANRVLYVGVTNNLVRRLHEHRAHRDPQSFTARYHVYRLIYAEAFDRPLDAIRREKQLKGWRRDKKLALIRRANPGLKELLCDPSTAPAARAPLRVTAGAEGRVGAMGGERR